MTYYPHERQLSSENCIDALVSVASKSFHFSLLRFILHSLTFGLRRVRKTTRENFTYDRVNILRRPSEHLWANLQKSAIWGKNFAGQFFQRPAN